MDDSGSPRTPNRLSELSSSHVQQLEVLRTMIGACGPYNLGGSVTLDVVFTPFWLYALPYILVVQVLPKTLE